MTISNQPRNVAFSVLTSILLINASVYGSIEYSVTDIGLPVGSTSSAKFIGNDAVVAGIYSTSSVTQSFAYSTTEGLTLFSRGTNDQSLISSINASGKVCGSFIGDDQSFHGFLYEQGTATDLTPSGAPFSDTRDLNAAGQVVGDYGTGGGYYRACLRQPDGSIINIGPANAVFSYGVSINNAGFAVGGYTSSSYAAGIFSYDNGVTADITPPGVRSPTVAFVGDNGDIYGSYQDSTGQSTFGCLIRNGVATDLSLPGATSSRIQVFSAARQVAIFSMVNGFEQASVYRNGGVISLTPTGSRSSEIRAINTSGQIIGSYTDGSGEFGITHNGIWENGVFTEIPMSPVVGLSEDGKVVGYEIVVSGGGIGRHALRWINGVTADLNDLIDPADGWILERAFVINNAGTIVCRAHKAGGADTLVMLAAKAVTPTPTPIPTPTPTPSPSPSPTPEISPTPTPSSSPTPSATPTPPGPTPVVNRTIFPARLIPSIRGEHLVVPVMVSNAAGISRLTIVVKGPRSGTITRSYEGRMHNQLAVKLDIALMKSSTRKKGRLDRDDLRRGVSVLLQTADASRRFTIRHR